MIALKKTVKIGASALLVPPLILDKSGVFNADSINSLLLPKLQSGSRENPPTLAESAISALNFESEKGVVVFDRVWNSDEWSLVFHLLDHASKNSTKTIAAVLREAFPKRTRGRPVGSVKLTSRNRMLRGASIQRLIEGGMSRPNACKAGAVEFSVEFRTAEKYLEDYQRAVRNVDWAERQSDFRRRYLNQHWQNRFKYRSQGQILKNATETLMSSGSKLCIELCLDFGDAIKLSIPPSSPIFCQKLLAERRTIHGALLLCVDPEFQDSVLRNDIILGWPETTVIERILDEVQKISFASMGYDCATHAH